MSRFIVRRGRRSLLPLTHSEASRVTERRDTQHLEVDVGDDLVLHASDTGTGPPLLLLHGFTGSSETWAPLTPAFVAAHRVIAIDLPGHGRSSAPASPRRYSLASFGDDLARVLDVFSVERVAIMGYSMGGRAALRFALAYPERLAALILESTSAGIVDPDLRRERIAADTALAERIERDGIEAFVDEWERLPLWESQKSLPDVAREVLRKQRLSNRADALANSLRGAGAGTDTPVHDELGQIRSPALVIAGALDPRYVEIAANLARSIPNASTFIVPDAGHAVHVERPEALADATVSFLRGVPSSGAQWA